MSFAIDTSDRNPRLYYLCVKTISSTQTVRCRTIAACLDEAIRTARRHYGPIRVIASGTRDLALGPLRLGRGQYLSNHHDRSLSREWREELHAC